MLNISNTSPAELQEKITAMREGGKIMGNLLKDLEAYVKPGMTGKEIDQIVHEDVKTLACKTQVPRYVAVYSEGICYPPPMKFVVYHYITAVVLIPYAAKLRALRRV